MNSINAEQLLQQLRQMTDQASFRSLETGKQAATNSVNFGTAMQQAMKNVSQQQQKASQLSKAFEMGDPNIDLPQVMIERQKSKISFEALLQVRNQMLTAYKDIMNMPL